MEGNWGRRLVIAESIHLHGLGDFSLPVPLMNLAAAIATALYAFGLLR
jgi:hypothetical protein